MNKPKKQKNEIMGAEIMYEERTTKSNDKTKKEVKSNKIEKVTLRV